MNQSELNEESKLNHPWFIYPNAFMSEYNNYDLYRSETKRLNKFIIELSNQINLYLSKNIKSLISIQLGSPMEDLLVNFRTKYLNFFQYQQLCPNYINNFANLPVEKKFIQIIIISPDKIFENSNYVPLFIKLFSHKFEKINNWEYIFEKSNFNQNQNQIIKVNIFNCPFPHLENRTNIIEKYNNAIKMLIPNPYQIENFESEPNDINFLNNFYLNINNLFKNDIPIIINSWVSFKNLYGIHENFNMFNKLLILANENNIIATEWDFNEDCFFCKIISNYVDNQMMSGKFKNIIYTSENLESFDELVKIKYEKIIKIFGLYLINFDSNGKILLERSQIIY